MFDMDTSAKNTRALSVAPLLVVASLSYCMARYTAYQTKGEFHDKDATEHADSILILMVSLIAAVFFHSWVHFSHVELSLILLTPIVWIGITKIPFLQFDLSSQSWPQRAFLLVVTALGGVIAFPVIRHMSHQSAALALFYLVTGSVMVFAQQQNLHHYVLFAAILSLIDPSHQEAGKWEKISRTLLRGISAGTVVHGIAAYDPVGFGPGHTDFHF